MLFIFSNHIPIEDCEVTHIDEREVRNVHQVYEGSISLSGECRSQRGGVGVGVSVRIVTQINSKSKVFITTRFYTQLTVAAGETIPHANSYN